MKVLQHSDITDIKVQNVTDCYSAVLVKINFIIVKNKNIPYKDPANTAMAKRLTFYSYLTASTKQLRIILKKTM